MLRTNDQLYQQISSICTIINVGNTVLNETHLCTSMNYSSSIPLDFTHFSLLVNSNPSMSIEVEKGRYFNLKHLFVVDNEAEKLDYEFVNDAIKIKTLLHIYLPSD